MEIPSKKLIFAYKYISNMKRILFIAITMLLPLAVFAQTAEECFKKGSNYYVGKNGVSQNDTEAAKWYRKAAEKGHIKAQYYLAQFYSSGKGVTKDSTEALKWYRKAAEQGDIYAQHDLACFYYNGEGVTKDYAEAVKWFRKSAERGDNYSQQSLGNCYYYGEGVTKDYSEAVKWYRKAAVEGEIRFSQYMLGICYYYGEGVTKDYTEAVKWYQKAAERGYSAAQNNLGYMYQMGYGVEKDYKMAKQWYEKAIIQDNPHAMEGMGELYEYGYGVTQNYQTAKEWYKKALAKKDISAAKEGLARVEKIISEQSKSSDSWDKERENLVSQSNQQQKPKEEPKKQETTTTNNVSPRQQTVTTTIVMPDVDKDIPLTTVKNPNLLAVIIGNEKYSKLPDVPYAENDAKMFKEYCEKTLGAREKNIRYLPNAGYVDIRDAVNWLKEGANSYSGDACVIFYYAGHGLPDPNTGSQYLLPADVDGKYLDLTVSLQKLYDDLGKMPARSVTVFLDACFSGTNRDNNMVAANSGARLAFTKSKTGTPTGKTVIFSAPQDDQTAHPYKDRKHGFFTYFLLKKLQESQGNATLGEIADYVTKNVKRAVFDEIQFSQTPSVKPSGNFANDWRNIRLK